MTRKRVQHTWRHRMARAERLVILIALLWTAAICTYWLFRYGRPW